VGEEATRQAALFRTLGRLARCSGKVSQTEGRPAGGSDTTEIRRGPGRPRPTESLPYGKAGPGRPGPAGTRLGRLAAETGCLTTALRTTRLTNSRRHSSGERLLGLPAVLSAHCAPENHPLLTPRQGQASIPRIRPIEDTLQTPLLVQRITHSRNPPCTNGLIRDHPSFAVPAFPNPNDPLRAVSRVKDRQMPATASGALQPLVPFSRFRTSVGLGHLPPPPLEFR